MGHDILVGVDASDASTRAVNFACGIVQRGQAETLLLVHVVRWSPFSFTTPEENEHRHKRRQQEIAEAERQILTPMRALVEQAGFAADCIVRHGDPADIISEQAQAEGARVVVVGRTGDSGMRERIFGSVTSQLVHTSPVPVVVVP